MWEELGFYEGFALMWKAILTKQNRTDECVTSIILIDKIDEPSHLILAVHRITSDTS